MKQSDEFCLVLTTCANQQEADALAKAILEQRLAACIQSSVVQSHYRWEGQVQSEPEVLLRIKTTMHLYSALEQYLKTAHSYEVPQIIQVPISAGWSTYLDWLREETS